MINTMKRTLLLILTIALLIQGVNAVANFQVTAFACSPSEVAVNEQFSCSATIRNNGDSTGTLSSVTLYPDHTNWLEKTSYAVTTSANVNSGATTEITFSNMKGKKTGLNGFARILLDQVTDTYVADNRVTVNTIDIVSLPTSSASSATQGSQVDVTAQANVGGTSDITLAFSVTSGGCSIGNQPASTTITGLTNGQTASTTWAVTMGSSTCRYSVQATTKSSPGGTATKTDTTTGSISCTGTCVSEGSSGSSSSGGGSGAGGSSGSSKNTTTTTEQKAADSATTTQSTTTPAEDKKIIQEPPKAPEQPPTPENPRSSDKWKVPLIIGIVVVIAVFLYRKYEM